MSSLQRNVPRSIWGAGGSAAKKEYNTGPSKVSRPVHRSLPMPVQITTGSKGSSKRAKDRFFLRQVGSGSCLKR